MAAYWAAWALFSFERLAMDRLDSIILDSIWMLFWPIMMDSTRDLLSAVVSWLDRGLGVLGLT
mgnify:FL=1